MKPENELLPVINELMVVDYFERLENTQQRRVTRSKIKKFQSENKTEDSVVLVQKISRNNGVCSVEAQIVDSDEGKIKLLAEINEKDENNLIKSVKCICEGKCPHIKILLKWLQQEQEQLEEPKPKRMKIKKEEPEQILSPLKENGANQKIVLKKVKKEVKLDPEMLEKATRLSIKTMMQNFKGKTVEEFNAFCEEEMLKENCSAAQIITVEQADTDIWHDLRIGRITASRLHEVSRCTSKNGSLVDKIMGKRGGFSFAMQRGTILEDYVFTELAKEYPNLKRCGLVLDPKYPFLGASPDGIADDFVLEIKCPANENTHADYIDVTKLSKKYFAQIQLQMLMTKKDKALLGVAAIDFETTRNITQLWIPYDEEYVMDLIEASIEFYNEAIFPPILRKYKKK